MGIHHQRRVDPHERTIHARRNENEVALGVTHSAHPHDVSRPDKLDDPGTGQESEAYMDTGPPPGTFVSPGNEDYEGCNRENEAENVHRGLPSTTSWPGENESAAGRQASNTNRSRLIWTPRGPEIVTVTA